MTDILQQVRQHKLWLVLMLLCFLVQSLALADQLRFDRQLIEQYQWWRIITGHITHLNWSHLLLNMAGLLIVMIFFSAYASSTYWLGALVFSAMFCSAGMLLDNQLDRYVGLSGVLHGLFVIGAWFELKRYKASGAILMTLITVKLLYEQVYGALPGSESLSGGNVAVNAHLYGGLAGALYLLFSRRLKSSK